MKHLNSGEVLHMDPLAGLSVFNAIATAGKTVYDIAQGTSKLEAKQQLMEVYDALMNLKSRVTDLDDENHDLKERLRFKGDDFEFKNPFWYEKKYPDRPLCAKCFAKETVGPMSEQYQGANNGYWRRCLVCGNGVEIERALRHHSAFVAGPSGPGGWMR